MMGEVSFQGIYVPALLVLAVGAVIATIVLARVLNAVGFYRFVAYRALVDLCLFVVVLGLFVWAAFRLGYPG